MGNSSVNSVPAAYIRLIMAALLGGIYVVGYLYPDISWVYSFPMKVLLSVIMVAIAVWPDTWTDYAKSLLLFYGINFMVAGATIDFIFGADI